MSPLLLASVAAGSALMTGYWLGSIPFGLLLTRAFGAGDLRRIGSGSIGATNVLRTGRRELAAATLVLDGAKGALAMLIVGRLIGPGAALIAGGGAMLGHCYPVWLSFRGGKGVATGLGILLMADWRLGLAACATWLLVAAITRISSAAALVAFTVSTLLAVYLSPPPVEGLAIVVDLLVFVRHRENIDRLLAGTEPRIGR